MWWKIDLYSGKAGDMWYRIRAARHGFINLSSINSNHVGTLDPLSCSMRSDLLRPDDISCFQRHQKELMRPRRLWYTARLEHLACVSIHSICDTRRGNNEKFSSEDWAGCCSGNVLHLYSSGARSAQRLSWLRVFLGPYTQIMPRQHFSKFQFIIYQ
jgi:hypothetical protein